MTRTPRIIPATLAALTLMLSACGSTPAESYKMTTETPPGIAIPDSVSTRLGTLEFDDGYPTQETAEAVYDQLDFQRSVEAVLTTLPGLSLEGFRRGIRKWGPDNVTAIMWEKRMDSKVLLLTPNSTVVYLFTWLDTSKGPLVIETPPNVLGFIDDHWFRYVTDIGPAGPDKGKGGKYLLLPPGYKGKVPSGYFVTHSPTFGQWLIMRGNLVDGSPKPAVENMKKGYRVYPLGAGKTAPRMNFVDVSGEDFNTLAWADERVFADMHTLVQEEPAESMDPETLGLLRSIGIEKGKPFKPDERMRRIQREAAVVADASARVLLYRSRDPAAPISPGSGWEAPWIGGSSTFEHDGARLIDARTRFHYYATGITPAMVKPHVGKGSQYVAGLRDSKGKPFDGGKSYRLRLAAKVPAAKFWAVTVYDVQTRSMLQTDQQFPELTSAGGGVHANADGTTDIIFSPTRPSKQKVNWIQTIPGRGWHMLFRLYGPEKPWFDGTWKLTEVEPLD